MKRREFLTASMGLAGVLVPGLGRAGSPGPCPPPQLSASGGGSISTSCENSAPDWFVNAPDGQWIEIARASEGKAISSVLESPVPRTANGDYPEAPYGSGLINHFGGAVTNQARAEMLVVCCGGHGSYHGNDGYALGLKEADPRWYCVQESTPDNQILVNPAPTGANTDGRLAALHGWGRPCFGGNRLIWMYGDSVGLADATTAYMWSWNREYPGMPTASPAAGGGSYLAHDGTAGPFTNHGAVPSAGVNDAVGPAVYDRNNDTAYSFSGRDLPPRVWWRNFASGTSGSYSPATSGVYALTAWAVHLHDLDVVLIGNMYGQTFGTSAHLAVWDKTTPTVYYKPALTGGTSWGSGSFQQAGAVYDADSRKVYVMHPPSYGANTIRVIDVPADPRTGAYTQRVYSVPASGVRWLGTSGTFGNMGLIEDMGKIGGVRRQALVYIGSYDDATFAMKLPAAGLLSGG